MVGRPGKTQFLSIHLSHILDEIGVSERVVKKIQQIGLQMEKVGRIGSDLIETNCSVTGYRFGSSIEGTSTRELDADQDSIKCFDKFNVVQEKDECNDETVNLLVHQGGDIPSGYCRLEILRPEQLGDLYCSGKDVLRRRDNKLFVKNDMFHFSAEASEENIIAIHGPALMIHTKLIDIPSADVVCAFKCKNTSKQMAKLFERKRPEMLVAAKESGFFVVPVGHRLSKSDEKELEWRVSPSLTERCLMFDMNITQIKCYVVLKMMKRDILFPKIGDCVTSFHLKTVLFHGVENTPKDLWKEENLLLCVNICLGRLAHFVRNRCLPNFLLEDENLFLGRVSDDQYTTLGNILEDLITSDGQFLFEIRCDSLGERLRQSQKAKVIQNLEGYMPEEQIRLGRNEYDCMRQVFVEVFMSVYYQLHVSGSTLISGVQLVINKLEVMQKDTDPYIVAVAKGMLQFVYSIYGSLLASRCILDGIDVTEEAFSFLKRGYGSDLTSGRLKDASLLFRTDMFEEAEIILDEISQQWNTNAVHICPCDLSRYSHFTLDLCKRVLDCNSESQKRKLIACDVIFSKYETYCCPPEMWFELFRSVGDDQKLRGKKDYWMDFIVVDSLTFLVFLMYKTYGKLNKRQLQVHYLECLHRIVNQEDIAKRIMHIETAYNLLGQCYEMEQRFDDALTCYRQSLHFRRRNNAAMWLVTMLMYKQFCRGIRAFCMSVARFSSSFWKT